MAVYFDHEKLDVYQLELKFITWVTELMDECGVEKATLMGMDTITDPYPGPDGKMTQLRWHCPIEYIKEEFLDKFPDRFVAIAGCNVKADKKETFEKMEQAKKWGFLGIKIHTASAGYPNDREKCYPIYEKCMELGLHVEIHTGQEEIPGTRAKYQDPVYIDDIAVASDMQQSLERSGMGLNIGCGPNEESGTFFSGLIDDVRIYNRAITP